MAESFGRLLKRHRVAAGLSQETLAELAGVSVDAISALERGARQAPQKATLELLSTALSLDADSHQQIEEAAKLARGRGPYAQRRGAFPDSAGEFCATNLPLQLTSFVGRESVVTEIKQLLQSCRLVAVVGAAGVGKTRCAIEIGGQLLEGFSDGVWLADLAPISDPALISTVIARPLGLHEKPSRPMLDTLLGYLKRKRLLLILDNCEHVIDEARRVAAAILHGCPDVCILATSRESFKTAGERAYRMPSLSVPSNSELLPAKEMSKYGAMQLFSDRAASADNRFVLTAENAPHVADICRRLDGIPLAIELAAARIRVLSPSELAQKLDERFRVLTSGDHSALQRHRTMRALIDWSYDLLSDDERVLFRRFSIFAGGFTLETASAACSTGGVDEIILLDLLSSLVDKSLVQADTFEGNTRYRLLESMRQYAREKLVDAAEEETMANAHAGAFLAVAERLDDTYETTPDREWLTQAEPELENFRAALSWTFGTRGDVQLGQRMAGALRRVWILFSLAQGQRWVQAAQERVNADTPVGTVAMLDLAECGLAAALNQYKACLAAAERALARFRELADPLGIAVTEGQIGRAQIRLGNVAEGEAQLRRFVEQARSFRATKSVIFGLASLGEGRSFAGDIPGARQRYSEALAAARVAGAERWEATIVMNLAEAEFRSGNADVARRLADEALSLLRAQGHTHIIAIAASNTVAYHVALRQYDEANTAAREAIRAARDLQDSVLLTCTLQHSAAIGALRPSSDVLVTEDRRRAARILGYVDARFVALETLRDYTEQQEYDAMIPALSAALSADELAQLITDGSAWSEDRAIAEAMLI
jgi:predicted ATPase/transcriptional regulator with XRE-family HTH domain